MTTAPIDTEALVIGAGPVGLFQVFQLGLQGVHCHVVDALPHVGGQCAELYAGKPIYDIPGIPFCTGSELVERLQQQITPFKPTLHLGQQVDQVERLPDQRLQVSTSTGQTFHTTTLFIAAGVGAFVPRRMVLDGLAAFEGTQVFAEHPTPERWAGQHLVVAGDGDTALQTCLGLSPKLGPVAQWGLAMERKQLSVNTENFGTSEPGIFAVGDINTYPGKKKLILCGFHEATLAAFGAVALLRPEEKTLLQYTTTSTLLHQRLGIA